MLLARDHRCIGRRLPAIGIHWRRKSAQADKKNLPPAKYLDSMPIVCIHACRHTQNYCHQNKNISAIHFFNLQYFDHWRFAMDKIRSHSHRKKIYSFLYKVSGCGYICCSRCFTVAAKRMAKTSEDKKERSRKDNRRVGHYERGRLQLSNKGRQLYNRQQQNT